MKIILSLVTLLTIHSTFASVQILNCKMDQKEVVFEIDAPSFYSLQVINGSGADERARLFINGKRLHVNGINLAGNRKFISFSAYLEHAYSMSLYFPVELLDQSFEGEMIETYLSDGASENHLKMKCQSTLF